MNEFLRDLFSFLPQPWRNLAPSAVAFLAVVALGMVARRVIFAKLRKVASNTASKMDDVLLETLHGPTLLWVIILGIHAATDVAPLPRDVIQRAELLLVILWILAVTIALSKLAGRMVRMWGEREDGSPRVGSVGEVLASLLIILLGALTLLRSLGIDITPVLTALGVGGLAVALALQDTLSNFFAGFYISLAGQIRVGDFVKLESGQEGFVTDIGWRNVTLRERPNNFILIPNNKLAQAIVTNYHLPERRTALLVRVGVGYECDPEHVERVLIDIASNIEVPGLLKDPAPFVRFIPGFGDSSLDFTLICQLNDVDDQFLVQHEIRKEIWRRFRQENINIPFPIRTIDFKNAPPTPFTSAPTEPKPDSGDAQK